EAFLDAVASRQFLEFGQLRRVLVTCAACSGHSHLALENAIEGIGGLVGTSLRRVLCRGRAGWRSRRIRRLDGLAIVGQGFPHLALLRQQGGYVALKARLLFGQ